MRAEKSTGAAPTWERIRRRLGLRSRTESKIVASGVVDREWYLEQNPDVRRAGIDPVMHFARHGFCEGRQPNPFFTGRWYEEAATKDETVVGEMAPASASILEIEQSGIVGPEWYLLQYPDVAAAAADPVQHYAEYGIGEGRQPNPLFSSSWYLAKHPEVAASGLNPVLHYIRIGAEKGFDPHPLFDSRLYLRDHPDISKKDVLKHFLKSGRGHSAPMRFPAPPVRIDRYPATVQRRIRTSPILTGTPAVNYLAPYMRPNGSHDDGPRSVEEFASRSHHPQFQIGGSLRRSDLAVIVEMERRKRRLAAEYSSRDQKELISVIMPTCNRPDTILDAISSVIVQTYRNWELIIVEDGPDCGVEAAILGYGDERIRFVRHDGPHGAAPARNAGLGHAQGSALVHLDDDDQYDPDFLLICLNAMRDSSRHMIYCAQMLWQGFDETIMAGSAFAGVLYRDFDRQVLERGNYLSMSAVMHDRQLLDACGGFDEELTRFIDWDFFLRMTEVETPARLPVVLHHYYRNRIPVNITATASGKINAERILAKLEERRARAKPEPAQNR